MRVLKARYRSKEEFLEAYDASVPGGALFCPTTTPLEDQEEVVVEVHFPELPNKMMLLGTVISWRAALPRLRVRAGATVAFAEAEESKRDFVLEVANGGRTDAVKRRHARLPVERPVRWRRANSNDFEDASLREISIGGAQLITEQPLEADDDVILELTMPGGAKPIELASKVAYDTPNGYGLRFIYRDGGGSRRLREMVRRLIRED
ncbi:MAG: PilZ domain-containing protein [Myxococcales bacterium]|nr:PilZ domain-containing protein [Myxococcales bacterium]